jgi:hypothetical protein
MPSKDGADELPRTPWRRRLLVLLLAVGTAWTIVLAVTQHAGEPKRHPAPPAAAGGKADVILVAPSASSAAR